MPCSNCGGVLAAGANNCPACGVSAPQQTVAQMQASYGGPPPQSPTPYATDPSAGQPSPWKWGYSRWVGITYGPIPVGVIVVVIGYIIYSGSRH